MPYTKFFDVILCTIIAHKPNWQQWRCIFHWSIYWCRVSLSLDALSVLKCNSHTNSCEDAPKCYVSTRKKKQKQKFTALLLHNTMSRCNIAERHKSNGRTAWNIRIALFHYWVLYNVNRNKRRMWLSLKCNKNKLKMRKKAAWSMSMVNAYVYIYMHWFKIKEKNNDNNNKTDFLREKTG